MGTFLGRVIVEWLEQEGEDRDMRLGEKFTYVDNEDNTWSVPAGAVINGASIPQVFWSSFGSPFLGDYRRASVIHDYYCQTRNRSSEKVHNMFYDACVDGGVAKIKAKTMYLAVVSFGPHWTVVLRDMEVLTDKFSAGESLNYTSTMDNGHYKDLKKWIENNDPSLVDIKKSIEKYRLIAVEIKSDIFSKLQEE